MWVCFNLCALLLQAGKFSLVQICSTRVNLRQLGIWVHQFIHCFLCHTFFYGSINPLHRPQHWKTQKHTHTSYCSFQRMTAVGQHKLTHKRETKKTLASFWCTILWTHKLLAGSKEYSDAEGSTYIFDSLLLVHWLHLLHSVTPPSSEALLGYSRHEEEWNKPNVMRL